MRLGIEVLLNDSKLLKRLHGKRVAMLGHPASLTSRLEDSLQLLVSRTELTVTAAFGPQHGMRGEKQDNMIESEDYRDPKTGVPVFSLYSHTRRPTDAMMDSFDVLLFDIKDVGTRVYTYMTTLLYMLEAAAKKKKEVWILDRPNPIGRPVEGFILEKQWESFVGATQVPMRHGLTLGELALFMCEYHRLDLKPEVVKMDDYSMSKAPGWGWPIGELPWVNPSPNVPVLCTARCYPGTVLLEGTNLSEGRGTTRPLQIFGAPGIDSEKVIAEMRAFAPQWMEGCLVRPCYFEPTFHKYKGELCSGLQMHVDSPAYDHERFKPYRFLLLYFKTLRKLHPDRFAWRQPPYEYETERLPIDLLNGNELPRKWVDDPAALPGDLEKPLAEDEALWLEQRRPYLLYR
jgi:uncharacterized protein YbbC (DUF1343 family)